MRATRAGSGQGDGLYSAPWGRPARLLALSASIAMILAVVAVGLRPLVARAVNPCGPPVVNPVACENTNPGSPSTQWDVSGSGDPSIQGFATDMSVNRGGTISFKINTTASSYSIGIFRMGYYQGNGARKIAAITPSAHLPQSQPACLTDSSTGLVDCGNWAVSASWTVPATAVSGVYLAVLVRPDTGGASQIPFVVRDDSSHADIMFQTDDTTWQAYNQYGGNSLYLGSAPTSDGRAYKVSYNRPFATRGQSTGYGTSNFFFYAEYPMIRFLEANGYDISYSTDIDADRSGALIKNHKTLLTAGHDEYWSAGMRASVEAARDAGVNLALFTGNDTFWKVRFENSIDGSGTSYRTLVCYKETKSATPLDPMDPPVWTGTWRDPSQSPPADGGRPENAMSGQIFMVNRGSAAITVPAAYSKLRFWRNTSIASLAAGQTATLGSETIGYEWDEDLDNGSRPAGEFDLSSTTVSVPELLQDYGNTYVPGTAVHHLTLYRAPSGALVFGAGTVQWAWGLDVNHDTSPDSGPATPDARMQQATVNLLADMGVQPATIQSGLVAASPSTDTTPPTSTITSPAAGAALTPGTPVTITGTAADTGGGVVAGVEVSVDGGTTWHPATGTSSWSYSWTPVRPGSATIRSRAVDDSANLESPGPGVTVIPGGGSPLFVSRSTTTDGARVTAPPNAAAGDVMLAIMEVDADPVSVTGPPGWTLALDVPTAASGSTFRAQVWKKVVTASEPGFYTWTVPGTPWVDIGLADYANVNTSSPIDVISGRDAGTTSAPTTASVTTNHANDLLVASFINYNTVSWTPGSGMTQRYSFDGNTAQDALQASAGSTGTKTATAGGAGPTAALLVALNPGTADTTPPTVSITAPASGATVSGTVTVSASASDNVGVAAVQFQLDGVNLGSKLTSSPYSMSWDTTTTTNGSHTLTAIATDTSGNQATSAPVTVTVSNAAPPPPVISSVQASGVTSGGATITWTTDRPSDTTVQYGTSSTYGSSGSTPGLVTSHSQALSGLASSTTYHYQVLSKDAYGQTSTSGDFTFTTTTPGTPPSFRSASSAVDGSTVARPSGVAAGDLLLAQLEVDADPVTVTGPAGWTLLLDTPAAPGTGSAFHAQVWYKVATASEPASYTWTVPGSPWVDIGLLAYSGVNTANPIDVASGQDVGSTATPSTAAVTTTSANDLVAAIFVNYDTATWTAGSGMTKRLDSDGSEAQDLAQVNAGSTGTRTATASVNGPTTAQIVALKPR